MFSIQSLANFLVQSVKVKPILLSLALAICSACELLSRLQGAEQMLPGLSAPVQVCFDEYAIPHIYAENWADASRVLGYLHARDRLWQMELLRRRASGTLAEISGPDALPSDQLMRQLGILQSCVDLWKSNLIPVQMRAELEAYAAGVNARLAELEMNDLPPAFQMLGYRPRQWEPVDSLVFSKYMGWDQSGTLDDLWLGSLVEKLGHPVIEELWPIDRPYEQPTVSIHVNRQPSNDLSQHNRSLFQINPSINLRTVKCSQLADSSCEKFSSGTQFSPPAHLGVAYLSVYEKLYNVGWFGRGYSFGSNNWAVSGGRTASGKPIVCSDPHLGFSIPSIWYTAHLSVRGANIAGVTFPGAPTIVIGHSDHIAWGVTNMQADAVDFYVETIDPNDPQRYLHRGEWKNVMRRVETIMVRGGEPQEFIIDSTIHGPIIQRAPAISLCWTGLGPTTDSIAFWKMSRATNLSEFLEGSDYLQVPALNVVYADIAGNIAMHCCGRLPLKTRGQGRIPMDGASGQNDWAGWIPRHQLPLSVNPPEEYVASANGRPHPVGYPHYLGWMWDPSYRTRRIKSILKSSDKLTVEKMKAIQYDHFDEAASRFLPTMLAALQDQWLAVADEGALLQSVKNELASWNYSAEGEFTGPTIWMRWLEKYRESVWQDLWDVRGVTQPSGSWGFTGDNRREPVLEVLEYLTLEMPESAWFDDLRTPERETRDELLRKSFVEAVLSLKQQLGSDIRSWQWKKVNLLKINSLTGDPQLSVEGGPVVGDSFTLNPGGSGGPVGGGASWRMIVDFGNTSESVGVYPGGQNENPTAEHYADQVPVWARGQYLGLHAVGSKDQLPPVARQKQITFR